MEKGGYRYLRILDLNKVSDEEIKKLLKKELYKRRLKLIQSSKLHGKKDHGSQYMGSCCAVVRNRSSKVNNRGAEVIGQKNSKVDDHAWCTSP